MYRNFITNSIMLSLFPVWQFQGCKVVVQLAHACDLTLFFRAPRSGTSATSLPARGPHAEHSVSVHHQDSVIGPGSGGGAPPEASRLEGREIAGL